MSDADSMDGDMILVNREDATMCNDDSNTLLSRIGQCIETLSNELRGISLDIHDHPELRFKERHAHEVLTTYLQKQPAWKVTPSAFGLDTAFVAVFEGHGTGPVVSFNAEYGMRNPLKLRSGLIFQIDALPGLGHACGHNLIALVSLAAALATAKIMHDDGVAGKVVLFGTPAEEGGGGKIKLLEAGAYRDHGVDVSLICHPSNGPDAALVRTAAFRQFDVEYFGKEAHAAAAPWDGVMINALDALIAAINNISAMRQQTQPGDVIQYRISNGGSKPNIIHAYAAGVFVLRAPTLTRLTRLEERFHACIRGAATATSAKLHVIEKIGYLNHVPNRTLGASYRQYFNLLGGAIPDPGIDELTATTQASTDQGDISHAYPSLSPEFWIRSETPDGKEGGGNHTPDFARAARTKEAHQLSLRVAKALTATAVEVLTIPDVLKRVKEEFHAHAGLAN